MTPLPVLFPLFCMHHVVSALYCVWMDSEDPVSSLKWFHDISPEYLILYEALYSLFFQNIMLSGFPICWFEKFLVFLYDSLDNKFFYVFMKEYACACLNFNKRVLTLEKTYPSVWNPVMDEESKREPSHLHIDRREFLSFGTYSLWSGACALPRSGPKGISANWHQFHLVWSMRTTIPRTEGNICHLASIPFGLEHAHCHHSLGSIGYSSNWRNRLEFQSSEKFQDDRPQAHRQHHSRNTCTVKLKEAYAISLFSS